MWQGNLVNSGSVVDRYVKGGDAVYSIENEELEEVVANLLIYNNITISIAESCRGHIRIDGYGGYFKVFEGSVISYSNDLKINMLGVNKDTLERYGAVVAKPPLKWQIKGYNRYRPWAGSNGYCRARGGAPGSRRSCLLPFP